MIRETADMYVDQPARHPGRSAVKKWDESKVSRDEKGRFSESGNASDSGSRLRDSLVAGAAIGATAAGAILMKKLTKKGSLAGHTARRAAEAAASTTHQRAAAGASVRNAAAHAAASAASEAFDTLKRAGSRALSDHVKKMLDRIKPTR